jgi:hypothetical protein
MMRTDSRPEGWPISHEGPASWIVAYCGVELVEQAPQMPNGQQCCVCQRPVPAGGRAYIWQDHGGAIGHEGCLNGAITWNPTTRVVAYMPASTYGILAFPDPPTANKPCPDCKGTGVTGNQFKLRPGDGRALLVDDFCPACGGCGDQEHRRCGDGWDAHPAWMDLDSDQLGIESDGICRCSGRGWNPESIHWYQGVAILRVPCCCTANRMQLVEVPDAE